MLRVYLPVAVALVLIGSLTIWEARYSNRWSESTVSAEDFGKRFANLPKEIGPWIGEDHKVDDKTLDVAGAVNHVSRTYVNSDTNEQVDLWLIVGHARDVGRHTPDVCYPSQGFTQDGYKGKHPVEADGEERAEFFTARFRNEKTPQTPQRVFWAWSANRKDDYRWDAPDYVRLRFGNNSALYKMYFTAQMQDKNQNITDSAAYKFAEFMLPVVNRALYPERYKDTAAEYAATLDPSGGTIKVEEKTPAAIDGVLPSAETAITPAGPVPDVTPAS